MAHSIFHALATIVIPAGLTIALASWCTEFYRPSTSGKSWYLALVAMTVACMVVTATLFVTEL